MTEEFIKKHNIHVMLCGPEYDKPDDKYYAVPRKMGILKHLPRTDGISTSDIIKRIRSHGKD
jgi:choline-phosphate cytidylyltransferase